VSAAATTLQARAVAQELARSGVREVVVAPGSRSTPLVLALARHGGVRMRVHVDERSAAFFALGVGKARGGPAAVVTTSGTATANLLPAVVEAAQAETPLLLLTADRPGRLRGADANQAIDQHGLYGGYVRAFFPVGEARLAGAELRHLRGQVCRAVAAAQGPPAGPVHLNLPFDKPFEPVGDDDPEMRAFRAEHPLAADGRPDDRPFVTVARGRPTLPEAELGTVSELLGASSRGVVVAGPAADGGGGRQGAAALALAAATGFPLLADPLSGARFGPGRGALVVTGHDLFLRDAEVREALAPELILRVGASPTSAALQRWLFHHQGVEQVVLDGGERWKDHGATATRYLRADAAGTLQALARRAERVGDGEWRSRWHAASEAARHTLEREDAGEPWEGQVLARVAEAAGGRGLLFVSNSMPVRDLDAFARPADADLRVLANRGASGIDGIVSTAFGVATAGPTVCVLGDLAFFHDQNGLLWARERDLPVLFVLVDNDGGSIFRMLPVADQEPWFTEFFTTPLGVDQAHAAALHGLPFEEVSLPDLAAAVRAGLGRGETRILRVRTDSEASHARRDAVARAVIQSVRAVLE
jgi:2-succinyl-5-enolpyruvyl-6-hydroxy-3-cyclohexene-1-carboxylate synthase